VTIGTGSLLVTAYCYFVHGQSLEEALNLTFASTVVGMVRGVVLGSTGGQQRLLVQSFVHVHVHVHGIDNGR
jgi:ABC-type microcin C transport system permease subunit YejE